MEKQTKIKRLSRFEISAGCFSVFSERSSKTIHELKQIKFYVQVKYFKPTLHAKSNYWFVTQRGPGRMQDMLLYPNLC